MAALDQIVNNMPVANQRRQQQQQAATDLQLQQAIKAVPPKAATTQIAQTLGAGAAQTAGQQMIETAKQNLQTNAQAGNMAVDQKSNELTQNIAELKRGQDVNQMQDEQAFANISEDSKREMFDSRMQFSKDEMGRLYMNERQLADYAVNHVKSDQQLKDYAQQADQLHQRKMQTMEVAAAKIDQELQFQNTLANDKQDHALKQKLVQAKAYMDKKIAKEKADEANRIGTFSTVVAIGVTAAVVVASGGTAAAYAPAIYAGTQGAASAYASKNDTPS